MSTKIYSGFKFDSSNFGDVQAYVNNWRSRIPAVALNKANTELSKLVVKAIDDADINAILKPESETALEIQDQTESPLYIIVNREREEALEDRKQGYRNPSMDFDFEVDLIFYEDAFYGVTRTDQSDWAKAWIESEKDISDYSYWDNSDRPDGVQKKEWKRRGEMWNTLLKTSKWRPAYAGFTCIIHNSLDTLYKMGKPSEIIHFQPEFDSRVEAAIETAFRARHLDTELLKDASISQIMKAHSDLSKMMNSAEYEDEVSELRDICKKVLRRELTTEDISKPYKPRILEDYSFPAPRI